MGKRKRKNCKHCEEFECCEEFPCCEENKHCNNKRINCTLPSNIRELLCLLVEDDCDDNRATLVLDTCCEHECVLEDVEIVAVFDDTVIVRCDDEFSYINICCICEVKVDCDDILDELLESCSKNCHSKDC